MAIDPVEAAIDGYIDTLNAEEENVGLDYVDSVEPTAEWTAIRENLANEIVMSSDRIPDCGCGAGQMELRCAGRAAMYVGRYYLKCPVNGKHVGSFKWYDEYQREEHSLGITGKGVKLKHQQPPRGIDGKDSQFEQRISSKLVADVKINVVIVFTGIMLAMLGFMMGKLM